MRKSRMEDLTGQRFGKQVVIAFSERKNGRVYWNCLCDCGNSHLSASSKLKSGRSLSCGCGRGKSNITHNMSKTRPTAIWNAMKQRCSNPKTINYERYGARGITVCEKWLKFDGFWEDMQEGYSDDLTLDRIDGSKGYFKENCKWATPIEQSNNTRRNRHIEFNGETKNLGEWAKLYGINNMLLLSRLNSGWDIEKALTQKVRKMNFAN